MAFDTQIFDTGVRETPLPSQTQAAAGTVTSSATQQAADYGRARSVVAQINVTAVGGTPSLVVNLDDSVDGGANWRSVVASAAITATGVYYVTIPSTTPFGNRLRPRGVLSGTTPSATYQIDWVVKE